MVYLLVPSVVRRPLRHVTEDPFYLQAIVRFYVALGGMCVVAYLLVPGWTEWVRSFRDRWRPHYSVAMLSAVCCFLAAFIVFMGRRQFGGYDFSLMVDLGWRQFLGEQPYVDFVTSSPPGFNLGVAVADRLFGPVWESNLYLCAVFACITFLWMYWQFRALSLGRVAALGMAFAIECSAMLTLCFWWYNNTALMLAAIFLLACLVYARHPRSLPAQFSYFCSLLLLALMKPNIAGVTIVGGVVLLLVLAESRLGVLAWTAAAGLGAIAVLALCHVSLPALAASYASVAHERGGLGAKIGFRGLGFFLKTEALLWIGLLSLPMMGLASEMARSVRERRWKGIAFPLLLVLGLVIALYGLLTNGEFVEVECTALLAAGAVIVFGLRLGGSRLHRVYVAVVCGAIAATLTVGAGRTRVYTIGAHMFFEWQDHDHVVEQGFLRNMHVSKTLMDVEQQVQAAAKDNPGSLFLGPRIEFNYAVLGVRSPDHLPLWWQPGTAFARSDEERMVRVWDEHRFATLIFLKDDFTFFSKDFLDDIARSYIRDDRYSLLTVYRRRAGT